MLLLEIKTMGAKMRIGMDKIREIIRLNQELQGKETGRQSYHAYGLNTNLKAGPKIEVRSLKPIMIRQIITILQ